MQKPIPETTRPGGYLFAGNFNHARTTATIDWGWTQVGSDVFETPSGERVRAISETNQLKEVPRGMRLYLGWRWWEAPRAREVDRLVAEGRVIIVRPENANV